MSLLRTRAAALVIASTALLGACNDDDETVDPAPVTPPTTPTTPVTAQLQNRSVTPNLLKDLAPGVQVYTLISSDDVLPGTPAFRFGGSADGAGIVPNANGGFTLLTNHEDNFSVSRVEVDKDFKPLSGEYILNSTGGRWRLCSASMATPDEHGYGPVFLTVGESGRESQIHAVNPFGGLNTSSIVEAFGRWNSENALPMPRAAYPGKTIVIIGDDDSGTNGGQVVMYMANREGDINSGELYVLARADDNTREMDMVAGQTYPIEFRPLGRGNGKTGAELETIGLGQSMMQFGRVEDLDYRKGSAANNREVYFNVTGQNNTGVNASYSRSKYSRVYKLVLDANDPTKGTIEVILDGDDRAGVAGEFQNVDNIYVGENYLYTQEDPNGYGDETHDARIYQYDLRSRAFRSVMELDHRRDAADAAKYNVSGPGRLGSWEYGAMIDVSKETGIADSFVIALQPHTWRGSQYQNPDGGTIRVNENQASMLVMVTGLPR